MSSLTWHSSQTAGARHAVTHTDAVAAPPERAGTPGLVMGSAGMAWGPELPVRGAGTRPRPEHLRPTSLGRPPPATQASGPGWGHFCRDAFPRGFTYSHSCPVGARAAP